LIGLSHAFKVAHDDPPAGVIILTGDADQAFRSSGGGGAHGTDRPGAAI
jgi:1,4-dihydroxy-2-naphthoyl-CoA synthase